MADTSEAASEAGRVLIARRWGPPGSRNLQRSAQTVIDRADELPDELREQLHEVTAPQDPP